MCNRLGKKIQDPKSIACGGNACGVKKCVFLQKRHFFEPQLHHEGMQYGKNECLHRERAWFEVSENHPKFDPSPFGHGVIT